MVCVTVKLLKNDLWLCHKSITFCCVSLPCKMCANVTFYDGSLTQSSCCLVENSDNK